MALGAEAGIWGFSGGGLLDVGKGSPASTFHPAKQLSSPSMTPQHSRPFLRPKLLLPTAPPKPFLSSTPG